VINTDTKQGIESLCNGIDKSLIQDFLSRMDDDYFVTFPREEIAAHIRMSSELDGEHPVQLRITPKPSNTGEEFEIVIVGFDHLSEFSIFCGLLSAFGLDIRAGDIYSFARRPGAQSSPAIRRSGPKKVSPPRKLARLRPRKIVDVFRVGVREGEAFDEAKQREFEEELRTLARLQAEGSSDQARERLNRFLVERVERMDEPLSGLLSPIEITFDNALSQEWTVISAQSEDSFAFLYAVSNALTMRGVYIHKVRIRSGGQQAHDQFFIADRWGRKIEDANEQERLRTAVTVIKQFTRFLPEAPDPPKAMRHFDQLLDKIQGIPEEEFPDRVITFLAGGEGMNLLAHLLGSSDFLWDDFLGIHFRDLLPVLEDVTKTPLHSGPSHQESLRRELRAQLAEARSIEDKKVLLNRFKDGQVFLIDARHLLDPQATLLDFSHSLTDLAEVVLDEAASLCYQHLAEQRGKPMNAEGAACSFAIFGLGKFGGREMGYASDLELLFVHEDTGNMPSAATMDRLPFFEVSARQTVDFIEASREGIFRIDLRLRPYGDAGPLSLPLEQFRHYYSLGGQAAPFERQALIKLRRVAGNEALGRKVEEHRDAFTYSGAPWDSQNALHLRRRQIRELAKSGQINVKYSAGGIVDIEYAVQYLQILHGAAHPDLRVTGTLEALDHLHRLGIIESSEYGVLREGYLFMRNLIDALRIVRGDASDLVLPDETSEELKSLARRLGHRERDRTRGAELLAADVRDWMTRIHDCFVRRFSSEL
jgi:glutamate-ammonia-ligase adenylyltransferase